MRNHNEWYKNTWIWLIIISSILAIGVFLFALYLYKIELIKIDISAFFMNKNGYFDMGIFWSFAGFFGSTVVAILAYKLSRQLKRLEERRFELETHPFVEIKNICHGNTHLLQKDGENHSFENIEVDTPDLTSAEFNGEELAFFEVEIVNTSNVFCVVENNLVEFIPDTGTPISFRGNSGNICSKNTKLYLSPNEAKTFAFIYSKDKLDTSKSFSANIELSCRNGYGTLYDFKRMLFIWRIFDGKVAYMFSNSV